jgi:hypothetical protein
VDRQILRWGMAAPCGERQPGSAGVRIPSAGVQPRARVRVPSPSHNGSARWAIPIERWIPAPGLPPAGAGSVGMTVVVRLPGMTFAFGQQRRLPVIPGLT